MIVFLKSDFAGEGLFAKEFLPGPALQKLLYGCGQTLNKQEICSSAHELKHGHPLRLRQQAWMSMSNSKERSKL